MDIWRFASVVWRRLWLIAILTIAAAVTAYVASQSLPREYDSEARVLVGSLTETNLDQLQAHQQLAQTYAEVALTTPVLTRVIDRLGWTIDPTNLILQLQVRAPVSDSIVRVDATASSPSDAAQLANAMADEIVQFGVLADGQPSLASIIQPAVPPDEPSSPHVLLNTLIAGTLGLLLGIGIALLLAGRPGAPGNARSIKADERSAPDEAGKSATQIGSPQKNSASTDNARQSDRSSPRRVVRRKPRGGVFGMLLGNGARPVPGGQNAPVNKGPVDKRRA